MDLLWLLLVQLLAAACSYGQANLAAPAQAPSSTPATCQVTVNVGSSWQLSSTGPQYAASLELQVTNPGGAAIAVPFSVDVTNPAYLSALSAINWQYNGAVQGGTISGEQLSSAEAGSNLSRLFLPL